MNDCQQLKYFEYLATNKDYQFCLSSIIAIQQRDKIDTQAEKAIAFCRMSMSEIETFYRQFVAEEI